MTNYSRSVLKSNGLRHPKNLPVKFGFSPKTIPTNIAKKLPPQRYFKPFLIAFSTSRTNGPRLLSRAKAGTHSAFGEESHTAAYTAKHGPSGRGVVSLPSTRTARSRTSPGRVPERRTLPLWDLAREVLSKNAESLRDSDALMRVAVPKASQPRWAA